MIKSGVYKIQIANSVYYGSSLNIYSRKQNHLNKLRSGKHRNKRLQKCFDKYGESAMSFEVIVICDKDSILDEEQKILDKNIGKDNCVNFCRNASAPMSGLKFSDEHKKRMSDSQIKNKYVFYYKCGNVESFNSLKLAGDKFGVRRSIVSKWFKRKNLGRTNGILYANNVVRAEKSGDENIVLLPYEYKKEPWIIDNASSKSQYYRKLKNESKASSR